MSNRDDLAAVIGTSVHAGNHIRFDITGDRAWFDDRLPRDLADGILAAGYRPPARTVSTVDELRALPEGTIVRSSSGTITSLEHGSALLFGMDRRADPTWLKLPLTVIHEGGA